MDLPSPARSVSLMIDAAITHLIQSINRLSGPMIPSITIFAVVTRQNQWPRARASHPIYTKFQGIHLNCSSVRILTGELTGGSQRQSPVRPQTSALKGTCSTIINPFKAEGYERLTNTWADANFLTDHPNSLTLCLRHKYTESLEKMPLI